ncbi:MAG: protease HtpX [Arenimonas sp.]|jgi:heat shock protein HtpX
MFKRVALLVATNLAVMVLLGLVLSVLQSYFGIRLGQNGQLLLLAAMFGFGGAFISLMISKWVAKRSTGMVLIDQPKSESERWLVDVVSRQAQSAGIKMPEVGIYDAPEINAFATGPSRNNSLVAVSTGLLRAMTRDEAEAVLGHEISHVANGDMVTMTLLQGVMNTFVIFLSRVVGRTIDAMVSGNREGGPSFFYYIVVFALDMVFGMLAQTIVMWFSRYREFRADAGGAHLAGKEKMIAALQRLGQTYGENTLPSSVKAFGISGGIAHGMRGLFMSHPPLEVRIRRLRETQATMS